MGQVIKARARSTRGARTPLAGMLADIRALSDIGIRFFGSAEDAEAARYLVARCTAIGLEAETVPFPVMGWRLREEGTLEIVTPGSKPWKVVSYPYVYPASTPKAGARGRVVAAGRQELFGSKFRAFERPKFRFRKYSILDQAGAVAAQIVSRDFPVGAAAAAWGVLPLPRTTPTVMIGEEDGRRVEDLVAKGNGRVEATLKIASTSTLTRSPPTSSRGCPEPIDARRAIRSSSWHTSTRSTRGLVRSTMLQASLQCSRLPSTSPGSALPATCSSRSTAARRSASSAPSITSPR